MEFANLSIQLVNFTMFEMDNVQVVMMDINYRIQNVFKIQPEKQLIPIVQSGKMGCVRNALMDLILDQKDYVN